MSDSFASFEVRLAPESDHCSQRRLNCRRDLWEEDMGSLPSSLSDGLPGVDWHVAEYPWRDTDVLVPDAEWFHRVLTSRNYPVVSRTEQASVRQATVVIAGLSVGRSVATQLARFGVEKFVLADGDCLAPANMNRLHGASVCDLGLSKVESVAREILEINPWCQVRGLESKLTGALLDEVLEGVDNPVVIEMIDDVKAKLELRLVAKRHGAPVIMATDVDWNPMVDIELADAPLFGGRLSGEDVGELEAGGSFGFERRTEMAMKIMALPSWPPRSLLGGQLAQSGLMKYWPQIGPAASATAALTVRAVLDVLRGADVPERAWFSISGAMGTADPVDESDPLARSLG